MTNNNKNLTLKQQLQQEFTYTCTTIALEKFREWLTQKLQELQKDKPKFATDHAWIGRNNQLNELLEELNQ